MQAEVLIVDDEFDIRRITSDFLSDEGYRCRSAADTSSALEMIEERRPHLVVLDIWLRGDDRDGLEFLKLLNVQYPEIPIVMISGHGTIETAVKAIKLGAYDFVEKPFKADRLVLTARRAMDAARLQRENAELRERASADWTMIGRSQSMSQLRSAIDRVAPTGSRVMISGPPGSGKEVAARACTGVRNAGTAPSLCSIARPWLPSAWRASFSVPEVGNGAAPHLGTFEQAHGGTLLLDEVADMPLETQGKIVRVLQEQSFARIGGATRVTVDVRVIATTSRDLSVEMAARPVPTGPVLPAQRGADRDPLFDVAARRHTAAVPPFRGARRGGERHAVPEARRGCAGGAAGL